MGGSVVCGGVDDDYDDDGDGEGCGGRSVVGELC